MAEMRDQVLRKLIRDAKKEGLTIGGLHEVRVRCKNSQQEIPDVIRWLIDPHRKGRFDYWADVGFTMPDDGPTFVFVLTDPDTAMELKLTWG